MKYVENRLKDKMFTTCKKFTDLDDEFLTGVRHMIKEGSIAKKVAQTLKKELEKTLDPLEMLAILRRHIKVINTSEQNTKIYKKPREIILSMYQSTP